MKAVAGSYGNVKMTRFPASQNEPENSIDLPQGLRKEGNKNRGRKGKMEERKEGREGGKKGGWA